MARGAEPADRKAWFYPTRRNTCTLTTVFYASFKSNLQAGPAGKVFRRFSTRSSCLLTPCLSEITIPNLYWLGNLLKSIIADGGQVYYEYRNNSSSELVMAGYSVPVNASLQEIRDLSIYD